MKRIDEIQDDEIRVIGHISDDCTERKPKKWLWILCAFAAVAVVVVFTVISAHKHDGEPVEEVFDPASSTVIPSPSSELSDYMGDYSDTLGTAYTEQVQQTINDITLDIYIPHNAKPVLFIGVPDKNDKNIVLTTQAADIRADNKKINGAFVLAGQPLAWGLSKKGFVGIIDGQVTVGVAENSPLFEEATEKEGYFFRQYPLVDNGTLIDNAPKGKTIRKAICDREGEIMIVMTQSRESFHDFAQALVDMGVTNAVYLVGSDSHGFFRDESGKLTLIYEKRKSVYEYENYIMWKAD